MPALENRLCLVAVSEHLPELPAGLGRYGFDCQVAADAEEARRQITVHPPDLVVMAVNGHLPPGARELLQSLKGEKPLPVVALVTPESLSCLNGDLKAVDDFAIQPCGVEEVALRIKRLFREKNENRDLSRYGNLTIDTARCEVTVNNRPVDLTFREYELLRFLAANRGRVFSREALLDRVWGYDYYGGDRTVDVHIRRLRSKIEDVDQTFIETVRNIGYRFRHVQ